MTNNYFPEVTVTDKGGLQDTMNITFTVTDINDNAPVFDSSTLNASLAEDVAIGRLVLLCYYLKINLKSPPYEVNVSMHTMCGD